MKPKLHKKIVIHDERSGQEICGCGCGHVLEEKTLDFSFEQQTKNPDNKNLPAAPISSIRMHDKNLSAIISKTGYDYTGKRKITPENNHLFHGLRRENIRSRLSNQERRMAYLLQVISDVSKIVYVSDAVRNDACYLANKIQRMRSSKGKNTITVAVSLLYLASKRSPHPKNLKEFFPVLGQHRTNILTKLHEIQQILNLDSECELTTDKILEDLCRQFKIKPNMKALAFKFLKLYEANSISTGVNPKTRAAVCLQFAIKMYYTFGRELGRPCNCEQMAAYLKISYSAISNRYTDLKDFIMRNSEHFKPGDLTQ